MAQGQYKPDDMVAMAALRLRASGGEDWQRFLVALQVRASELADIVVNSPPDVVFVNQGKAREANALLKLLNDAPALVARIEQRSK